MWSAPLATFFTAMFGSTRTCVIIGVADQRFFLLLFA
jgi:hypothetical protein